MKLVLRDVSCEILLLLTVNPSVVATVVLLVAYLLVAFNVQPSNAAVTGNSVRDDDAFCRLFGLHDKNGNFC